MAIESPEGSDPQLNDGSLAAALVRRLPRILLVTLVAVVATYLVLPFVPATPEAQDGAPTVTAAPASPPAADAQPGDDSQLAQLQQRVTDADTRAANFKIANSLYTGGNGATLVDQQVSSAVNAIAAAEARRDAAQSHSALIRSLLDAGQPLDSVDDIRNSVAIQQLEQQRGQITAQRAQLLATFLPSHPGVVTATAQITAINKQIDSEARRVADALDAEATLESKGLGPLQQALDELSAKQAAETRNAVTLDALERDATADRAMLQSYLARYDAAPASAAPDAQPADIHATAPANDTPAAASGTPAARNTVLILALVGFLALAIQVGAVVLLALLSRRTRDRLAAIMRAADEAPYQHDDQTGLEPDDIAAPLAATGDESGDEQPVMAAPMTSRGLRRWFTRHAHTADALPAAEPLTGDLLDQPAAEPIAPVPETVEGEAASILPDSAASQSVNALPEPQMEVGGAAMTDARGLANLSADLILGRARVLVLASLGEPHDGELMAERLASDAIEQGLSVAHVDAGSQRVSAAPGITDLAADLAGFGDVVFKVQDGLAEVPWGQLTSLDLDSDRPATLVEALSEVYEVVLVATGAIDAASSLVLFARLDSRLVLVGSAGPARLEACRAEAQRLGFRQIETLATPNWHAEVA